MYTYTTYLPSSGAVQVCSQHLEKGTCRVVSIFAMCCQNLNISLLHLVCSGSCEVAWPVTSTHIDTCDSCVASSADLSASTKCQKKSFFFQCKFWQLKCSHFLLSVGCLCCLEQTNACIPTLVLQPGNQDVWTQFWQHFQHFQHNDLVLSVGHNSSKRSART